MQGRVSCAVRRVAWASLAAIVLGDIPLTFRSRTLAGKIGSQGSTDGIGTEARLGRPRRVVSDFDNVYVTESDHTVRWIDSTDGSVLTLAGKAKEFGDVDGVAADARFNFPAGICSVSHDESFAAVFVSDINNHKIRVLYVEGGSPPKLLEVTTVTGGVTENPPGKAEGNEDGSFYTAKFSNPDGLDVTSDKGIVYVADEGNHKVRSLGLEELEVTTVVGTGEPGLRDGPLATGMLEKPRDVAVANKDKYVYVIEAAQPHIRMIDLEAGLIKTVTSHSRGRRDGLLIESSFDKPYGIDAFHDAWTGRHALVVAELDGRIRVARFRDGQWSVDTAVADPKLEQPWNQLTDVSVDVNSNVIYAADRNNYAVRRIEFNGRNERDDL